MKIFEFYFNMILFLSRSLLLATSDSGGLPGHASGCLQAALLLLMLSVEAALFGLEAWHRQGAFYTEVEKQKVREK